MSVVRDIGFLLGYDMDDASVKEVENSINGIKNMHCFRAVWR